MKKVLFTLAFSGALLLSVTSCNNGSKPNEGTTGTPEQQASVYQCPMQCEGEKTYDKPGKCPVCGMELKPVQTKAPADTTNASGDTVRSV